MKNKLCIFLLALFISFSGFSQKADSTKNQNYFSIGFFVGSNTFIGISSLVDYKNIRFEFGYGSPERGIQYSYLLGYDIFDDGFAKMYAYASLQQNRPGNYSYRVREFFWKTNAGIGFELGKEKRITLVGFKGGYIFSIPRKTITLEGQIYLQFIIVRKEDKKR